MSETEETPEVEPDPPEVNPADRCAEHGKVDCAEPHFNPLRTWDSMVAEFGDPTQPSQFAPEEESEDR